MTDNLKSVNASFIAIDWGSTNFRAYVVDESGHVKERTKVAHGLNRVSAEDYEWTLRKLLGKWINKYPNIPLFMSACADKTVGRQHIDPVPVPIDLHDLADHVEKIKNHTVDRSIYLVPTVTMPQRRGVVEMLDGEEVQVLGIISLLSDTQNYRVCLPGNLTKWVEVEDKKIKQINSTIAGELYNVLANHFTQHMAMDGSTFDLDIFIQGVEQSRKNINWLQSLSQIRHKSYDKNVNFSDYSAFLSGYLIGQELRWAKESFSDLNKLVIIASNWLTQLYEAACNTYEIQILPIKLEDATVKGFWELYKLTFLQENY